MKISFLLFLSFCIFSSVGCQKLKPQEGSEFSAKANAFENYVGVRPATLEICATGGVEVVHYSDLNSNLVLDSGDVILSTTPICNGVQGSAGAPGQNAQFAMGAVGPWVENKGYSACHHDYLFFPDPQNGGRGWLTFRHQKNGSADQGIGSTGFQIWNVDIADFSLASEVGGVTYCTLHWNASAKKLDYKVVDPSDGLAGLEGSIQF